VLAGCSAGFDATSIQPYAPGDGVLANSGDIRVLNALVVAAEGERTGVVSMTVVNRGTTDDRLTDLTSPHGSVDLTGDTSLPAGGTLRFGSDTDVTAVIRNMTAQVGQTIRLRLSFARNQPVTLDTVVMPATGDYAEITPSATPTPTPTPTPTEATSSPEASPTG
jgi:copper(I)-binding protein